MGKPFIEIDVLQNITLFFAHNLLYVILKKVTNYLETKWMIG